jgi:predicted nucleic acid-binding protein
MLGQSGCSRNVARVRAGAAQSERTDRLIAATAAELGHPLITKDERIQAAGVEVVW